MKVFGTLFNSLALSATITLGVNILPASAHNHGNHMHMNPGSRVTRPIQPRKPYSGTRTRNVQNSNGFYRNRTVDYNVTPNGCGGTNRDSNIQGSFGNGSNQQNYQRSRSTVVCKN